ncbi:hypothetical protein MMC31_008086 [Peltigera leucophlebia]|nr:hypothetical protein [Peltigera leucophlebia]
MLSLPIPKNDCGGNYPAPSNRTRQPVETRHFIKEVAPHHHQVMLPRIEDWILFPDEVIKYKNPRVRNVQNRTPPKSYLRQEKSLEDRFPSSGTAYAGTTRAPSKSLAAHDSQDRGRSLRSSDQRGIILDTATNDVDSNLLKMKPPPRLPTPDLSDVDEDEFWSCCGASASSRLDTLLGSATVLLS